MSTTTSSVVNETGAVVDNGVVVTDATVSANHNFPVTVHQNIDVTSYDYPIDPADDSATLDLQALKEAVQAVGATVANATKGSYETGKNFLKRYLENINTGYPV